MVLTSVESVWLVPESSIACMSLSLSARVGLQDAGELRVPVGHKGSSGCSLGEHAKSLYKRARQ
eukprot:1923279-Amphidinium_carterae.1